MRPLKRGNEFEAIFKKQALMQGFYPEKNHLACRRTPVGFQLIKSKEFTELDFKLVYPLHGEIGFFELKSFMGSSFAYSELNELQIERSAFWNELGVRSGFVIWLRGEGGVYFFTGEQILKKGPRQRFHPHEGIYLGNIMNLCLGSLFA